MIKHFMLNRFIWECCDKLESNHIHRNVVKYHCMYHRAEFNYLNKYEIATFIAKIFGVIFNCHN